jgi:hypothetical protein
MIEPSAGCSWETRTPAAIADSETSLTAFVEVDIGLAPFFGCSVLS